jgi:hypothetical protein
VLVASDAPRVDFVEVPRDDSEGGGDGIGRGDASGWDRNGRSGEAYLPG